MQRQRLVGFALWARRAWARLAQSILCPSGTVRGMTTEAAALRAAKATLRAEALARRAGLAHAGAGEALAQRVLQLCPPPVGATVAGFWPMGDEMDVRPLLHALHDRGHPLALPVTTPRGQPLRFRRWRPGALLEAGVFGTSHPADPTEITPNVLLVPLLAFDGQGNRLGYGGGYYDRTLALLPAAFRLGVAFAGQQVPQVPAGPHDLPLHAIATEAGIIRPA